MSRVALRPNIFIVLSLLMGLGLLGSRAVAQDSKQDPKPDQKSCEDSASTGQAAPDQASQEVDPLKKPLTQKQKKKNERSLKQELRGPYKKWLDEDVAWIITDEERQAFRQLSNDEGRDQVIEAFWQRRDPPPNTEEHQYQEEHYQRIPFPNQHFPAGLPRLKHDPGRTYTM